MAGGVTKMSNTAAAPKKRRGRTVKACEGCRALKTRCQFTHPALVCDKCIELNTPCTMLPKALAASQPPRKRRSVQKRTQDTAEVSSGSGSSELEESPGAYKTGAHGDDLSQGDHLHPAAVSSRALDEHEGIHPSGADSGFPLPPSEAINGTDAVFDSQYPPFDFRAVLDPETYVPDPSPLPSDVIDGPSILDPSIPEAFYFESAIESQETSPDTNEIFGSDMKYLTNPKNRILFNLSPMFMALHHVDSSLQSSFGITSKLLKGNTRSSSPRNIISLGILSREHVSELLGLYRLHLNHWVLLPTSGDLDTLIDYLLQKSPLLISVCCSVALRLCSREAWTRYYPPLVDYLSKELSITLARSPQNVEFLQAIMLLSIYGTSLSYQEHIFDPWYLSGLGIQHCMTNTALLDSMTHHHLRIWNHLVHVHMHGAMMTGRMPLLDSQCIDMCRKILQEPFADRFDNCLLTEILLYEISLKFYLNRINYATFTSQLSDWRSEWGMVLTMTSVQFADPLRHLLTVMARITHEQRLSKPARSPISAATLVELHAPFSRDKDFIGEKDVLTAECFKGLSTEDLILSLTDLNSAVSGIVMPAAGRLFRYLSDMLHDVAFSAAVLAITVRDVLANRTEVSADAAPAMSGALIFARRLAELFHATSRGADTQQSRCYALVTLLQTAQ